MSQESWSEYTLDSNDSDELTVSSLSLASKAGGYEYQFLEEPVEDLKCSICLSVLRDPHLTSCCGNHFCEPCIKRIKAGCKSCPLCQQHDFTSMLDKSLCRKVNELLMRCPNSQHGCKWIADLKSVDKHLDTDCGFVQVKCHLCKEFVFKSYLAEHRRLVCHKRRFTCSACGKVDTWEMITSEHCSLCPNRNLSCPNNCDIVGLKQKNVKSHIDTDCPLQPVRCEFLFTGCGDKIVRKDVPKHNADNLAEHLSLLATKFSSEMSKKDEEIKFLKATVREQSDQISKLKSENVLMLPVDFYFKEFNYYESSTGRRWFSTPFTSHPHGYKMCLCVYPHGVGKGTDTHVSVFVHIMRGEHDNDLSWPFRGKVMVTLVTEFDDFEQTLEFTPKYMPSSTRRVVVGDMNKIGQGLPQFVNLVELIDCSFLHFRVEKVECECLV